MMIVCLMKTLSDELPPIYNSLFTDASLPSPILHSELYSLVSLEGTNHYAPDLIFKFKTLLILSLK